MTIQDMRQRKKELGYSNEQLSALSGVPLGTIMKIFGGATKSPRRSTIEALERVLSPGSSGQDNKPYPNSRGNDYDFFGKYHSDSDPAPDLFRETFAVYGEAARMDQGHVNPRMIENQPRPYTVDDYCALPEDIRTELIDGVFYDMSSPSVTHQLVIGELYLQFKACERKHKGKCRVILSPCDVQLNKDKYTMVQPDLMVVCDLEKIKGRNCFGAPDLIVEVLSPSSRSHDCVLKLNKYRKSGIREYWIADPEHRQVITYLFDDPARPACEIYSFTDIIPIHISGGECTIDMRDVLAGLV